MTVVAIVAMSLATTQFTNKTAERPPEKRSPAPAASSPGGNVITNSDIRATRDYWTAAKMRAAKPATPMLSGPGAESYGTSNLDFTRSRISPLSANQAAPYKTTGKLFFTDPGVGDFVCSAATVGKRVVITAAHCLYGDGRFFTNWTFVPGYDGSRPTLAAQRPFGTWTWSRAQVPQNWIDTAGALPNATDFATLVFADQVIGGVTTSLYQVSGRYPTVTGHLFDNHVTILGYPCNFDSCNIMQRVDTGDHRTPPGGGANAYEYGSDMTGGSSGGPWLENFGLGAAPQGSWTTRNSVVAVTSYGYLDGGASLVQGASQLDSRWTTIRNQTCAAAAGNC